MLFYPEGLAPSAPSSKTLVSPVTCRAGRRSVVSEPTSSAASRFCSSALQHSNTRPKPDHQKKNEDDRFFDDHLKTRSKQKAKKKKRKNGPLEATSWTRSVPWPSSAMKARWRRGNLACSSGRLGHLLTSASNQMEVAWIQFKK